jgi:streptogramin lyase
VVAGAWSEDITWATRPDALEAPFASFDATANPTSRELRFDVTSIAQAAQAVDGVVSIRISAVPGDPAPLAYWEAREGSSGGFVLDLALESQPPLRSGEFAALGPIAYVDGEPFRGVLAVDPDGATARLVRRLVSPDHITSLAIDPVDGDLFVIEFSPQGEIRRLPAGASGVWETFGPENLEGAFIRMGVGGELIVLTLTSPDGAMRFLAVDAETGTSREIALLPPAVVYGGFAIDASGDLIVADWLGEGRLLAIDSSTGVVTEIASGGALPAAASVAVGPDGAIVVGTWNSEIVAIDRYTGVQTLLGEAANPVTSIVIPPDGEWIVAHAEPSYLGMGTRIQRFDPVTGVATDLYVDKYTDVRELVPAPDGSVWMSQGSYGGALVTRLDRETGHVRTIAATPFDSPGAVVLDGRRRLVATSGYGDRVVRVDPATGAEEVLLGPEFIQRPPGGGFPSLLRDLSWGPAGRLFAVQDLEPRLVEIDLVQPGLHPLPSPSDLTAIGSETGGPLFAIRRPNGEPPSIVRIDPDAGGAYYVITQGGLLVDPMDVGVARDGTLLVAEQSLHRVVSIDPLSGAQAILTTVPGTYGPAGVLVGADDRVRTFGPWFDVTTGTLRRGLPAGGAPLAPVLPRCRDGWDNDGDGSIDWPADAQCTGPQGGSESVASGATPACGLGIELLLLCPLFARRWRWKRD